MIGRFFGVGSILVRIAKDVGGARDHFDFDFFHVVSLNLVFLDRFHHGGERRVAERFDRETLHPAIENPVVRRRRGRQIFDQAFAIEACGFSLVLHVLNTANKPSLPSIMCSGPENPSRASSALSTPMRTGPRIDGVLHVRELAGRQRARTERSHGADADRLHHLIDASD